MNGLLKYIFTWIAGIFNLGVYLTDNVDTLLLKLQILKQQQMTNEMEQLYSLLRILEIAKILLITLSFVCIVVLNHEEFARFFKKKWNFIKRGGRFLKNKFSIFKNKEQ